MRRITPLVLVVLGLTACGDFQPLDPDGGTPTPGPSPLPSDVAQIRPNAEQALAAGRYSDRFFEPRVIFAVEGDTWFSIAREPGFFDIQQGMDDQDEVIAVQFATPTGLYGADGSVDPTDAAHAAQILGGNTEIGIVETDTSEIDGLVGSQVTFENTGDEVANFMDLPPGTIAINPGRRLWVAFFDHPDGLVAIMVGGSIEGWDAALAAAEPVLESITIGLD